MNSANEVLKTVLADHQVTQTSIAKLFDVSPQAINNKFKRGTWDVDEVVKILESIGCRLVIESGTIKRYIF